jgi:hypothetical protein
MIAIVYEYVDMGDSSERLYRIPIQDFADLAVRFAEQKARFRIDIGSEVLTGKTFRLVL